MKGRAKSNVTNIQQSINSQFQTICNNHIKEYGTKVETLIKEQEAKEIELENHINAIKNEIAALETMEDEISLKRIELKFK